MFSMHSSMDIRAAGRCEDRLVIDLAGKASSIAAGSLTYAHWRTAEGERRQASLHMADDGLRIAYGEVDYVGRWSAHVLQLTSWPRGTSCRYISEARGAGLVAPAAAGNAAPCTAAGIPALSPLPRAQASHSWTCSLLIGVPTGCIGCGAIASRMNGSICSMRPRRNRNGCAGTPTNAWPLLTKPWGVQRDAVFMRQMARIAGRL